MKRKTETILWILYLIFAPLYLIWRIGWTIPFDHGIGSVIFSLILLTAEILGIAEMLVHFYTELSDFMFEGCTALEQISLPSTLETINWAAFKNSATCMVDIPESVKVIEDDAFSGKAFTLIFRGAPIVELEHDVPDLTDDAADLLPIDTNAVIYYANDTAKTAAETYATSIGTLADLSSLPIPDSVEQPKYSVTVTNGTADSSGKLTEGTSVTITANDPEEGMQFARWDGLDDLTITSGDAETSVVVFTMPAHAVAVTAVYESVPGSGDDDTSKNQTSFDIDAFRSAGRALFAQEYDITASASEGGAITPDGRSEVKYDKNITYTITPDEGYEIVSVLVDGKDAGAVSEYTFKHIKDDHTIHAIFAEIPQQNLFTDVDEADWFYEDVQFVGENGLMVGTNSAGTKFSPDTALNRAMLVTILWRLEGEPAVDGLMQFTDVPADEWYTEAVRWAAAEGIVNGYEDDTFRPINDVTREQVMAILHRYAAFKGLDSGVLLLMIPQYDYSLWAENDIIWADMSGLTSDLGTDIYDMTASANRAEIAAYLRRFCEAYMKK